VAHARGRAQTLGDVRPGLSARFLRAIERALSPDPAQRHQTAGEFRQALTGRSRSGAARPGWMGKAAAAIAVAAVVVLVGFGLDRWLAGGFDVEARLYRHDGAGVRTELASGAEVAPGDRLTLEVEGSKDLHVYVINEDDTGETVLLFPIPETDLRNPLDKDEVHELPGHNPSGGRLAWTITSSGGRERLLVVATRRRVEALESLVAGMAPAQAGYPMVDPATVRGIAGLSELPTTDRVFGDGFTDVEELVDERQTGRDLWVRRIELRND
jgi:hypothetical protein